MTFNCLENCGFCCVCVPLKKEILMKNQDKFQRNLVKLAQVPSGEIIPYTEDMKCIFLNKENVCMIYPDRPQLCKDFGVKKLKVECPFLSTAGNKRSVAKQKQLTRKFNQSIKTMIDQRDNLVEGKK